MTAEPGGHVFGQLYEEILATRAQMSANHKESMDANRALEKKMDIFGEQFKACNDKVEDHDKAIYGNGKPGLKTEMQLLLQKSAIVTAGIAVIFSAGIGWIFKHGGK